MKKLILPLSILYILPLSAQRHTGWGRGIDLGTGGYDGSGTFMFFFMIVAFLGIFAIYCFISDKIKENTRKKTYNNKKEPECKEDSKTDSTFVEEWSLITFVKSHGGKLQIGNFTDKETGDTYRACIVSNNGYNKIYVYFHPQLGELTSLEVTGKEDELFVGLEETGRYYLYEKEPQSKVDDMENILNIDTKTQKLTDKQKITTLVFLCAFTNPTTEKELEYKAMLGVNLNCVTHYPLKERFLYGGIVPEETKKDMLSTMASIKNKNIIDMFIGHCCYSDHFQEHNLNNKDFITILTNWGYNRRDIEIKINQYKKDKIDDFNTIPIFLIPLEEFQEIYGNIGTATIVSDIDGSLYDGYTFTSKNSHVTYALPSPFFGFTSLDKIASQKNEIYVQCGVSGCYMLCDKDIYTYRDKHLDEFCYCQDERENKFVLRDLNVLHNYNEYTITKEEESID